MAHHIRADRLVALIETAAAQGAPFAWLDPDGGLVLGSGFGAPLFSVDIGREALASRRSSTDPSQGMPGAQARHRDERVEFAPPASGGRQTGAFIFTLEDKRYAAVSQKQLLLVGLQAIESARPGSLEKLSRDKGRTKRVVSRQRGDLNASPRLVEKFSQRIDGGWWVFTNNSFEETKKFILRAAFHAGLHARIERLS